MPAPLDKLSWLLIVWLVLLVHSWTLPAILASLAHRALTSLKQDKCNVLPARLSQDNLVSHNRPELAALLTAKNGVLLVNTTTLKLTSAVLAATVPTNHVKAPSLAWLALEDKLLEPQKPYRLPNAETIARQVNN